MRFQRLLRQLCFLLATCSAAAARADDNGHNWPQFRGPRGNGSATGNPPSEFGEGKNMLWKRPVGGKGWSSPVVWGEQVWITTAPADGLKMYAICLDRKTGDVVHDSLVFENEKVRFCHPTNSFASCTPVIEEGRIYLHFGSYGTACLSTDTGEVIWKRRDFVCNHWRGPGASPVVDDKALYVAFDGYDRQFVVALDKKTGDTIWTKDRNIDYGTDNGDRKKAYGTATLIEHKGVRQLISPSAVETISYEPRTGNVIWRVRHGGMNAAARPLFGHGLVYITAGSGPLSMIAVRPDGKGDVTSTHIQWSLGRGVPKRPSQLLVDDHLFMVNDGGVASCLTAKDGETIWQKRLKGVEFRSSPVLAAGRIYTASTDGMLHVFAANAKEFQSLATNELPAGCQASPAISGDILIVRTTEAVYAFAKD
ncbi:MAG: PQQ-binding-like beta-propeller repeat protein [Pirellulaceae bacterium]|nr:PQQ-binding-like beta-propeller repeat protein [Pirellulaceae bacterium]